MIKLLAFILPGKTVSDRTRRIIECVMGIFCLCLYLALIVGVIMVLQDGLITKTVGRYMRLISQILLLLPVALGIAVWVIRRFKNRNSASRS